MLPQIYQAHLPSTLPNTLLTTGLIGNGKNLMGTWWEPDETRLQWNRPVQASNPQRPPKNTSGVASHIDRLTDLQLDVAGVQGARFELVQALLEGLGGGGLGELPEPPEQLSPPATHQGCSVITYFRYLRWVGTASTAVRRLVCGVRGFRF
jgi:hypothetical protein